MTNRRTLLLLDDDPGHARVFREALIDATDGPFEGEWITTLADGLSRLEKKGIWAIFLNLRLGGCKGLLVFDQILNSAPDVPVLVLGGPQDRAVAMEALQRGAKDYLIEGHIDCYSLSRAIRNMVEREAAEDALYTEKARAQVTLDSIGDAVISTDISSNVTYLNPVAELMTGWSRQDAFGRPFAEVFKIIDGNTRKTAPNPIAVAIEKNKTVALTPNCETTAFSRTRGGAVSSFNVYCLGNLVYLSLASVTIGMEADTDAHKNQENGAFQRSSIPLE